MSGGAFSAPPLILMFVSESGTGLEYNYRNREKI